MKGEHGQRADLNIIFEAAAPFRITEPKQSECPSVVIHTGDFSGTHPLGWHAHAYTHKSISDDGSDAGMASSQFHLSDLVDSGERAIERNITSASEERTYRKS